jgi:hypothetical protein
MGNTLKSNSKVSPNGQRPRQPPPALLNLGYEEIPILVLGSGDAGTPIFPGASSCLEGSIESYNLQTPRRLIQLKKYMVTMQGAYFCIYDARGLYFETNEWDWINHLPVIPESLIYVSDLSRYDQQNLESGRNQMEESLRTFRSLCWRLRNMSIIVTLTNKFEFREKLQVSNIADHPPFADFKGEQNVYDGANYFRFKFEKCYTETWTKSLYVHLEDPRGLEYNIDRFLYFMRRILLNNNLRLSGFVGAFELSEMNDLPVSS